MQPDFEFVRKAASVDHVFEPDPSVEEKYAKRFHRFRQLYRALRLICHPAESDGVGTAPPAGASTAALV